jgi:hypothetical protein
MSCLLFLVLASVLLLFASCPAFVVLMSSQSTRGEIALVRILDLNFDFGVGFIRKKRCEKPGVRAGLARWRWRISRRLWTPRTYPVVSACFMHQNTRKGSFPRMKSDEDDEESFQEIPGRFQGPRHAESSKRVRAKAPEEEGVSNQPESNSHQKSLLFIHQWHQARSKFDLAQRSQYGMQQKVATSQHEIRINQARSNPPDFLFDEPA